MASAFCLPDQASAVILYERTFAEGSCSIDLINAGTPASPSVLISQRQLAHSLRINSEESFASDWVSAGTAAALNRWQMAKRAAEYLLLSLG
jgi:hypothetical protein